MRRSRLDIGLAVEEAILEFWDASNQRREKETTSAARAAQREAP